MHSYFGSSWEDLCEDPWAEVRNESIAQKSTSNESKIIIVIHNGGNDCLSPIIPVTRSDVDEMQQRTVGRLYSIYIPVGP